MEFLRRTQIRLFRADKINVIPGIHHITVIVSNPKDTCDFYTRVLGLRLVKKTINFDDPCGYHLYFGDSVGSPGTVISVYPSSKAPRGRAGTGQATRISFAVGPRSLRYWYQRVRIQGMDVGGPVSHFGEDCISVTDPDGLRIEIVGVQEAPRLGPLSNSDIPDEHAIRGIHGVLVDLEGFESTRRVLTDVLGFRLQTEKGNRFRFSSHNGASGSLLDVLALPAGQPGTPGAGVIHHVAWRTPDALVLQKLRSRLLAAGINVTTELDRKYFRAAYFREPGGVMFALATDAPGFTVDEPLHDLGTSLQLPSWYEGHRTKIESILEPLQLPALA